MQLDYLALDTSTIGHLTKQSDHTLAYERILVGRKAAMSFQADAELLSAGYAPSRDQRLSALRHGIVLLPHSQATSAWYARVIGVRKALRPRRSLGSGAGDADVWIIASAMEHGIPLVSHDRQQIALAQAAGHSVFTNIRDMRHVNTPLPIRS
jgi:predicted nucleic acid-binding protein